MYALVAFDLDDTLAESKTPVSAEMADLLMELLRLVPVCVISGARVQQFEGQLLRLLPARDRTLTNLHLMPTCGTRYLRWEQGVWRTVYAQNLTRYETRCASQALEQAARQLGLWEPTELVHGERIEDRGSQVTFSALGQRAPFSAKKRWDPSGSKRALLRAAVQARLPGLEVRAGGSTSIDVTRKGIDKAYGLRSLLRRLNVPAGNTLFIGDRLAPGGNDYPVVALGVKTRAVSGPEDTRAFVTRLVRYLTSDTSRAATGAA